MSEPVDHTSLQSLAFLPNPVQLKHQYAKAAETILKDCTVRFSDPERIFLYSGTSEEDTGALVPLHLIVTQAQLKDLGLID